MLIQPIVDTPVSAEQDNLALPEPREARNAWVRMRTATAAIDQQRSPLVSGGAPDMSVRLAASQSVGAPPNCNDRPSRCSTVAVARALPRDYSASRGTVIQVLSITYGDCQDDKGRREMGFFGLLIRWSLVRFQPGEP